MSEVFHRRYPTYDVLDKWDSPSWNGQTRTVVKQRLEQVPPRRFLTETEWEILAAICDRLIPQPDRGDRPVPIVPFIDEKLHENQGDGYRYDGLPAMREAWRQGIHAIEEEARARWSGGFRELPHNQQDAVLRAIQHGDIRSPAWEGLPAGRFFSSLLLHAVVSVYYAHPAAWNEIGFGGPASPRGYVRLGFDRRDPWEAEERHEQ
ncbi:MAG TPA: gluconate 2-dehydrogenase subunit 3 family protein [Stellaceae bacterium]|nr:gluconate 2-dehydrogenase subunit 3 family protein [Stellaceae bacterium]